MFSTWIITLGMQLALAPTKAEAPPGKSPPGQRSQLPRTPRSSCLPPRLKPSHRAAHSSLDAQDKAMFRMLRRLYYANKRCPSRVWNRSFALHKTPTYLVNIGSGTPGSTRGVRAFLLNHPKPPRQAQRLRPAQVFGLKGVYLLRGRRPVIPAPGYAFQLKVHGVSTYAMVYGSRGDYRPTPRAFLALFLHEGFHQNQLYRSRWKIKAVPPGSRKNYPFTAKNVAYSLLENRILLKAYSGSRLQAMAALKAFFVVRALRISKDRSPQQLVRSFDNEQERFEGTAQYVEDAALRLLGWPFAAGALRSLQGRLKLGRYYRQTNDPSFMREGLLARFYATGAILGRLFERIADTQWKQRCRRGVSPFAQLKRRFGSLNSRQRKTILARAQKKHRFSSLLQLSKQFIKQLKRPAQRTALHLD